MQQSLEDKVVVITGASSGIGRATAMRLAEHGARLALAARRANVLAQLVEELHLRGVEALGVPADVGRESDVRRLTNLTLESFGRIDIWVNNAGIGAIGPFEATLMAEHMEVVGTNLIGTLHGSYHAYKQFLAQGSGILINVAADLGTRLTPHLVSYSASKHAVVGLDNGLRQEIEDAGHKAIHVCTVLPTEHDTPFFEHAVRSGRRMTTPRELLHDPELVVDAIVALAQDPRNVAVGGEDGAVEVMVSGSRTRGARRASIAAPLTF